MKQNKIYILFESFAYSNNIIEIYILFLKMWEKARLNFSPRFNSHRVNASNVIFHPISCKYNRTSRKNSKAFSNNSVYPKTKHPWPANQRTNRRINQTRDISAIIPLPPRPHISLSLYIYTYILFPPSSHDLTSKTGQSITVVQVIAANEKS